MPYHFHTGETEDIQPVNTSTQNAVVSLLRLSMAPVKRGLLGALLDILTGWVCGLPAESCSYTIEELRIPVGCGVEIMADLYRPISFKPVGTLFVHGPYGRGIVMSLKLARLFAARGYQVLFASCRGTFGSGGEFDPGRNEAADGQAIVTWMREQHWYTGSFATLGASYLGYTQWALLSDPPPDMAAAVINVGPHDFGRTIWGTGAFNSDTIRFSDLIVHQEHGRPRASPGSPGERLRPVLDGLPLLDAVDGFFGSAAPWLRLAIARPDMTDDYWKPMQQCNALERANIPILLVTGWYDIFLEQTMDQYSKLVERGCHVALTAGPWTHVHAAFNSSTMEKLKWFEEHLARRIEGHRNSAVRIFVTGAQEWRDFPKWPPPTLPYDLFLGPERRLSEQAPLADASESTFKFDPADPTPTLGGPLVIGGGRVDDTAFATRSDAVTFTTEPLDRDLEVYGKPYVELHHSSSHPYVDLFVRLSEVDSKGRSHNITEQYKRLNEHRGQDTLKLALFDCAHKFLKGARIRLIIAGGSHPQYLRNLGTEESPGVGSTLHPAWHTIHHDASTLSKVVLPVTRRQHERE